MGEPGRGHITQSKENDPGEPAAASLMVMIGKTQCLISQKVSQEK